MEEYHYFVEGTAKAPTIDFNLLTGDLIFEGKSIPENAAKVYEPLLAVVNRYVKSPRLITNFRLNLQYFNSASMLWLVRIIKSLARIDVEDSVLFIHIYLDHEDFDSFDTEEIREIILSLVDNLDQGKLSIAVKVHEIELGKVVKEATILL